jgi:histidinol phosphatase-like enzyme (inositol monophosphatase family)
MNNDRELEELLDFAIQLARGEGEISLKYFKKSLQPERKGDGSPVTIADREAERFTRARVEEKFPEDAILGEEEAARAGHSGRQWIIDPIDGTYAFVHGVPLYGVLIGLEINGEVLLGVVNLPALGEIVYAARGMGCFWNDVRARVSQTGRLEDALLLSTDFGTCERYGFGAATEILQRRADARRTWGDCYGHVLVATGRAEVMLDPVMNDWDCAPLLPIMEEAGGTFTDWKGRRTIRGGNAISTNGVLFEEVMKIVTSDK